jgi:hypothetical protein
LPNLSSAVQSYLQETLGLPLSDAKPWARASELPYFLKDAFEFHELVLLGQGIVLAMQCAEPKPSLMDIRIGLNKVQALTGQRAVYVTQTLASYERKRLIEQKVPFIVPGNQLYLPDLALDLREYFRRRAVPTQAPLSPSAQALLITALLHQPWQAQWQASALAANLGYTVMTLSRAVRELVAAGLASAYTLGRSSWLRMDLPPQQLWEQAKPALQTPVKRSVWVMDNGLGGDQPHRWAGLSALAQQSMLTEPQWPVRAISMADWKAAKEAGIHELPEPVPGAQEWQLWRYSSTLLPNTAFVDPLSLTLSLQNDADDRIQLALDELKKAFPW